MDTLFIVAPTVADEVRVALSDAADELLGARGDEFEIREIAGGEAFDSAIEQSMADDPTRLVAVGGDGTLSSVANFLVNTEKPLGIVPAGTGNLVARELGIPLDTREAVALLAGEHRLRRLDSMVINGRTYLLNAGVGVNAEVIDRTSRLGKTLFGRSAYVGTAVWEVLQARPQRLEICLDGQCREFDATDVLISNCGALARVLHPNGPDIRMDDGRLDVSIVCMKVPIEYPWFYFLRRLFPKHENRIIHELPASCNVTIDSETPIAVQADGDIIGTTPVNIAVHPNALSVIVACEPAAAETAPPDEPTARERGE